MDADSVCNDFHLRMTVATTEHERFDQLLSVLVPTPDTVVNPANLEAIDDQRNILVEAIGAVCEAYGQLDDCDEELDPDEAKVMDDAFATVKKWNEQVEQVMVQIRQVIWDNEHGHIRRLISGTHSRTGKRASLRKTEDECEVFITGGTPAVAPEPEPVEDSAVETDEEDVETEEEDVEVVQPEEEPAVAPEPVEEAPAPAPQPKDPPRARIISEDDLRKAEEAARLEGYQQGALDAVARLTKIASDDATADKVAAESKPIGRKPKQVKEAKEKPAKPRRTLRRKKTEGTQ